MSIVSFSDRPTDLPAPLTPLVGRADEIATLCALLGRPEVRFVTLIGPGGIGKTRLALHVAAEIAPRFADGAVRTGAQFGRSGPSRFRRRRHRQLADQPAVRAALNPRPGVARERPQQQRQASRKQHRDGKRPGRRAERVAEDRAHHRR